MKFFGITLVAMTISSSAAFASSDFCEGFDAGYIDGYKEESGSSMTPNTPTCPSRPLRSSGDPESDYDFGHNIGYERGQEEG